MRDETTELVYEAILREREYQDQKWGGFDHDDAHSFADWILILEKRIAKVKDAYFCDEAPYPQTEMRTVAAVAFACMEYNGIGDEREEAD